MTIPERIRKLNTPEGFYKLWIEEIKGDLTYKQAFKKLNREYVEYFGKVRYSSYDSFRLSQRERLMNKK